jgi:ribose transport system substrate-binding protein
MKKSFYFAIISLLIWCGLAIPSNAAVLVAFSQGDNGNSWRATNTNDMEEWAKKKGYDYIWADGKGDPSKQLSDIQDLLSRKPAILIVAPVQAEAVTPAAELANKAGIPLVTIDRKINATVGEGTYKACIVQDFTEVGRICARYMVESLTKQFGEPKGRVLEIQGTIGSSPTIDEAAGVREILSQYPNIQIIDSQSGGDQRAPARAVMEDFLNKYSAGSVDFLFSFQDDMTIGALQAMRDANRLELLGHIVSKDGMRDGIKEVVDGNVLVTPQVPPYFGEATMDLVEKILSGQPYDTIVNVPFKVFDMQNNKDMTVEYYNQLLESGLFF